MVVTMPASVLFRNAAWRSGVAGTIWRGEVGLAGGSRFEWRMAPLRSLLSLGFAADWKAVGPNTDLGGRMLARPGGRMVLDHVSGRADGALLAARQPNLPFTCDLTMQVEMERIVVGGGSGRVVEGKAMSDPGSCRAKTGGGAASAVPALILTADHIGDKTTLRIAPATQRRRVLVDAVLEEDGTLDLGVTPEGAAALPFLGIPGGSRIKGAM
ncbi:hypothetical protein TS85_10750 [Sphingomonas hengshuiensis]|uniref:General secretion pathway protein N n=2 Tax=Sphingomonas hengshuiensis TaxID=1609977 RepID=A0A7U5CV39_9SPHN|nr:hypothetical protein TS85_10750 [Sphingomonas hengshuiensis]